MREQPQIKVAVARVYPATIDRINISRAGNLAAARALRKLDVRGKVLLDGGLSLPLKWGVDWQAFTKGDEIYPVISLASIAAKVHRDELMHRYHRQYPHYDFARHVGYGTLRHRLALKKHGPCRIHRRSFKIDILIREIPNNQARIQKK
jgi:ribonuclease HII